jgi:heptosyltransferase III
VEILLLHPGGLGDIILSLPAIVSLRRRFPPAGMTIAGNVDYLKPIMLGYAERTLSLSALPLHRFYTNEDLSPEDAIFWRSYDRVVSWTGFGNVAFERRIRAIHPDACIGDWKPKPDDVRHVSQLFTDSLGSLAPSGITPAPVRISLSSKMRAEGQQWLSEHDCHERDYPIAIHPGAGSETKRWPPARFIELARHLAVREKRKLLVIEGPAEPGLARKIVQTLSLPEVILMEAAPLGLLAAVIERCRLFIGNDSGLAHLASALNVPCVLLFGPTRPEHWAPLGAHVRVIRNMQNCNGCFRGSGSHTCLENITVEEIIRTAASEIAFSIFH